MATSSSRVRGGSAKSRTRGAGSHETAPPRQLDSHECSCVEGTPSAPSASTRRGGNGWFVLNRQPALLRRPAPGVSSQEAAIRQRNCSRSHGSALGYCCAARPLAAPSDVRRTASARMHKRGHRDTGAVAGRRFADGDRANSLPCSHEHTEPLRSKRWCQRPCDRRHLGPGSGCLPSRRAPLSRGGRDL